jgi:CRP/FNR family transcriptional regulator
MTNLPIVAQETFSFFGHLPQEEISQLLPFFTRHHAKTGEILWHEGDDDNQAAFIISGKLGIKKKTEFSSRHIIVGTYSAGSVVGELCLLTESRRAVTAEVINDVYLLMLSNEKFEQLISAHPVLGLKLLRGLFKMTSKRLTKSYERIASIF